GRLAWLDRDAVKDHPAAVRDEIENQVAFADRAASREDNDIRGGAALDGLHERVERIGRRWVRLRNAAMCADDRRQREQVHVVDLTGPRRFAWCDDFVTRRKNRH